MHSIRRTILVSVAAVALALTSAGAASAVEPPIEPPSKTFGEHAFRATSIAVDAIFLRPLGTLRLLVGAAFYVPSVALAAPIAYYDNSMGDINNLTDTFINDPFRYTFQRPFGEDLEGN